MESRLQNNDPIGDAQCSGSAYDSQALPHTFGRSVVATQDASDTGEGFPVSEQRPFFKIWAAKALLSDDLDSLTDHERTIWFYALCQASLETPRWQTRITPGLARKCRTTPPKLTAALNKMAGLGMCVLGDGIVTFPTAAALNEETYSKPPSASPERVRGRVQKHRANKERNDPVTTPVTTCNDVTETGVTRYRNDHKEKEEEKEEEQEEDGRYTDGVTTQVREMRDWILLRLSAKYRNDPEMWEACESFARTYQGQNDALARAYDACIANGEFPGPRNLAKRMMSGAEPAPRPSDGPLMYDDVREATLRRYAAREAAVAPEVEVL